MRQFTLLFALFALLACSPKDAGLVSEIFDAAKESYHPRTRRAIANSLKNISLEQAGQLSI